MTKGQKNAIVITGGNVGIGFEAAKKLLSSSSANSESDTLIILGCRNKKRGEEAVAKLGNNPNVRVMTLDLLDFSSIREFVRELEELSETIPIVGLINNAGVLETECKVTSYGIESTLITNHFGHFLLTLLLIPLLKKSPLSHIVVVSSTLHDFSKGPQQGNNAVSPPSIWDNLDGSKSFDGMQFYRISKLFNIWFTYALDRRLKDLEKTSPNRILVNAVCPGFIPLTQLGRNNSWAMQLLMRFLSFLPFTRSLDFGAESYLQLLEQNENSGKFYSDHRVTDSSPYSYVVDEQEKLWELSEQVTGVQFPTE